MNKQLNEIASEAGIIGRKYSFGRYWQGEITEEQKKFAEMLIRRCAKICEDNAATYKHSFTPAKAAIAHNTAIHCALLIKRTFGINS
jgi:hypothetical protein